MSGELELAMKGVARLQKALEAEAAKIARQHSAMVHSAALVIQRAERVYARAHHRGGGKLDRKQHGRFARNIRVKTDVPGIARVRATGRVAHLVLRPVKAHDITASKAKALQLPSGYARRVTRPATPGDPFLGRVAAEHHLEAMDAAKAVLRAR